MVELQPLPYARIDPLDLAKLQPREVQKVVNVDPQPDAPFTEGRVLTLITNQAGGNEVVVEAPTLIRIDGFYDPGGVQPFQTPVVTQIFLQAVSLPSSTTMVGFTGQRTPGMIRGSGPLIYLPSAGKWRVKLTITTGAVSLVTAFATAFRDVPPEIASAYLRGEYSYSYLQEQLTILALGSSMIPSPASALAFGIPAWFSLVHLTIANITANSAILGFGVLATAAVGQPLAGNSNNVKGWLQMAGLSVSAFSTAGTTLDVMMRGL